MALKFREQKIHSSQKIEVLKDGLFEITFRVHDSDEVVRLLAQYGEYIRGIRPEGVYEKVREIWKKGLKAG
jgi:predicted DNA-binding transcriptional regulator YafY